MPWPGCPARRFRAATGGRPPLVLGGPDTTLHTNLLIMWRKNLAGDASFDGPRPDSYWSSGLRPEETPGFKDGRLDALPLPSVARPDRSAFLDCFINTWVRTEVAFSAVRGEEGFFIPVKSGYPSLVFFFAHPAVYYIDKMNRAGLLAPIDATCEHVFEQMSWDAISKDSMKWPSLQQVLDYRRKAFQLIADVIQTHKDLDGRTPLTSGHPLNTLLQSIEHERNHLAESQARLIPALPPSLLQ